jgi:hypothetical protein
MKDMDQTAKNLLNLMFRPGETVCVSHNQFGYHAIPLENAINGPVVLVPTPESAEKREKPLVDCIERMDPSQMLLVALNPIKGYRNDQNCTAFRNFLVEVDYGPLSEQLAYAKKIGLPYSACIFSGNKSLHFLISLSQDLPNENIYRHFSQWILHIMTLADQNTQNPSRSIRLPGAWREPTKQQKLVEMRGKTNIDDLVKWLQQYPESKPKKAEKRQVSLHYDFSNFKPWVKELLLNGLDPSKGRNKQWFSIACEFALAGVSEDDTMDILSEFFTPERDFKEREWKTSIRSGFKYIYERK